MTTVCGLDVATSTGLSWMTIGAPPWKWRTLAIEAEGQAQEEAAGDLSLALHELLSKDRPDFAAIEMPLRAVVRFDRKKRDLAGDQEGQTINPNALRLSALVGAAVATLDILKIPFGVVAIPSWRAAYYGRGARPAEGEDWKALALRVARLQKINLPDTVKAARDAAEAVGVACAWQRCSVIPPRHQAAFMALRTGRIAA